MTATSLAAAEETTPPMPTCAYWFGPPVAFGHCTTHGEDFPPGGCCSHERHALAERGEQARRSGDLPALRSALALLDLDTRARSQEPAEPAAA